MQSFNVRPPRHGGFPLRRETLLCSSNPEISPVEAIHEPSVDGHEMTPPLPQQPRSGVLELLPADCGHASPGVI